MYICIYVFMQICMQTSRSLYIIIFPTSFPSKLLLSSTFISEFSAPSPRPGPPFQIARISLHLNKLVAAVALLNNNRYVYRLLSGLLLLLLPCCCYYCQFLQRFFFACYTCSHVPRISCHVFAISKQKSIKNKQIKQKTAN